eukprot:COSAG03_NODE_197_length_10799_cov_5.984579_4_plen_280_part_00
MAARAGTHSSSAWRSAGGVDMPSPPPSPPRTVSCLPQAAGDEEAGEAAHRAMHTAQAALGSLLPTLGQTSTDHVSSQATLRLRAAAPTLSPVAATSSSPTAGTLASPTVDPPSAAEVLHDGSRLYRLPRQCMRYTQRLDGSWKQWGPMPLPGGEVDGTNVNDLKLKLHEAESRAAQLRAALGQAARQGKAQCMQFERRLAEMEAEAIMNAALGSDERARVQIDRLQTRVNHLDIEAADLRTEVSVARAASEKNRTALNAAKLAAEVSRKKGAADSKQST